MATEQNNIHINSFTKGMNTDTSLDMVSNELYVFGLNIRITNNTLLGVLSDSNSKEGIVSPVPEGEDVSINFITKDDGIYDKILAVASIDNVGVIIVRKSVNHYWVVYKVEQLDNELDFTLMYTSTKETDKDKFSIVINREQSNLTKVYIADGIHGIMMICLDFGADYYKGLVEEYLTSNMYFPSQALSINKKISGKLKTSQIQYVYRFYKKHGICSKPSPLTNKILVIDGNRSRENGNAEDTETTIGFQLKIPYTADTLFDYIQLYRISYVKPNTDAEINLIYDAKISSLNNIITINDTGLDSLSTLSADEFAALTDLNIVPVCIEQNLNYLFAANTTDKTVLKTSDNNINSSDFISYSCNNLGIYKYYSDTLYSQSIENTDINQLYSNLLYYLNKYSDMSVNDTSLSDCRYIKYTFNDNTTKFLLGGTGKYISWKFITAHIPLHTDFKSNDENYLEIPTVSDSKTISFNNLYYISLSNGLLIETSSSNTLLNYLSKHGVYDSNNITYNDIVTSSMLRSLKRDEVYRYGIIFYDEFGRHTNVLWIADIRTPKESEFSSTVFENNNLYARPLGIEFDVDLPNGYKSYQIVRCKKDSQYTKNLLQCVLSRPIRQPLWDSTSVVSEDGSTITYDDSSKSASTSQMSPYYPQQFLTSNYYKYDSWCSDTEKRGNASNFKNSKLFLIFNPNINIQRTTELLQLQQLDLSIDVLKYIYGNNLNTDTLRICPTTYYVYCQYITGDQSTKDGSSDENWHNLLKDRDEYRGRTLLSITDSSGIKYIKYHYSVNATLPVNSMADDAEEYEDLETTYSLYKSYKESCGNVMYYYNQQSSSGTSSITNIEDVLNPTWEQGWDNLTMNSDKDADLYPISNGSKTYKGYTSNIGEFSYVNWVCSNLYDLQVGKDRDGYKVDGDSQENHSVFTARTVDEDGGNRPKKFMLNERYVLGCQGPGPVCFLINLDTDEDDVFKDSILTNGSVVNGTLLCNIQHTPVQYAGLTKEEKQYDIYYGFGNFNNASGKYIIFDGDAYITPCEFVTMFKTYNFQSKYSLQSTQFVYYIPMETNINTYFDYGMNYYNTQSKNLQLEPGDITGIAVQDRPITLYNLIYSDNNSSNDLYNSESLEDAENEYTQRIHYSELKDNGEAIDSWLDYKSLNYIDADTRWGLITNLLTVKDIIYFWLNQAFGKLSVNERSLVTDNNNNTILLGQGGVLQRTDYIDTKHGMRLEDYSAINAEGIIYWIDIMNKAVILSDGLKVVNYSEVTNVLNLINKYINQNDVPDIDYDILNNELICKCLNEDSIELLIFNIKSNIATSVYTRTYDDLITFNNKLYSITTELNNSKLYNYIDSTTSYLKPTILLFCVNPNSSTTKVFDDLEIVTLNRGQNPSDYLNGKQFKFETNICTSTNNPTGYTDREGNIRYAIPRFGDNNYGNRMRGKWMKVDITDNKPEYKESISHIMTKFRQSFS